MNRMKLIVLLLSTLLLTQPLIATEPKKDEYITIEMLLRVLKLELLGTSTGLLVGFASAMVGNEQKHQTDAVACAFIGGFAGAVGILPAAGVVRILEWIIDNDSKAVTVLRWTASAVGALFIPIAMALINSPKAKKEV